MDEETLRQYVAARLRGQASQPPVAWSHGDGPEWFLIDAYKLSESDAFKDQLKRLILRLLQGWRPGLGDSVEYATRPIYLVGRLGVDDGVDILQLLEASPTLDGLEVDGGPFRDVVLRALIEFPGQQNHPRWDRLLHESPFFDTAYLAIQQRGLEEAMLDLPAYLDMAKQHPLRETLFQGRIGNLVARHFWPNHMAEFWQAIRGLRADHQQVVEAALQADVPKAFATKNASTPAGRQLVNGQEADISTASSLRPDDDHAHASQSVSRPHFAAGELSGGYSTDGASRPLDTVRRQLQLVAA